MLLDSKDVVRMLTLCWIKWQTYFHTGGRRGVEGLFRQKIRNIIDCGNPSDTQPVMAYEALKHYSDRDLTVRFVSNVEIRTDLAEAIRDLDPEETLFVVCSKTFTTIESLTNAQSAELVPEGFS